MHFLFFHSFLVFALVSFHSFLFAFVQVPLSSFEVLSVYDYIRLTFSVVIPYLLLELFLFLLPFLMLLLVYVYSLLLSSVQISFSSFHSFFASLNTPLAFSFVHFLTSLIYIPFFPFVTVLSLHFPLFFLFPFFPSISFFLFPSQLTPSA